jgi:pimeloyl-ACP methyl ester carboxylesterase
MSDMPYVDLPDARVHYDTTGDAGTPVLLVMGFGVPGRMWLNQIPALAARHRVAWFDNAGAGKTERRRRRPHTMRDLGRHAAAVIEALGWDAAHVVGVSMGGMIAQELAISHGRRVRSLSLVVTHPGGLRHAIPRPSSLALFARAFLGPREGRTRALERLIFPEEYLATVDVDRLRSGMREQVVSAAPARDRLSQIAAVLTHRAASRLPSVTAPTLVVKAARDRLIAPTASHRLQRLIPNARLVEFEDAGHALLHQCAARLNRELLDHFEAVDRAGAGPDGERTGAGAGDASTSGAPSRGHS